jgi:hypothetical protein
MERFSRLDCWSCASNNLAQYGMSPRNKDEKFSGWGMICPKIIKRSFPNNKRRFEISKTASD